jgi:hypothetical protein
MALRINVLLDCVHRSRFHKTWISLRFGEDGGRRQSQSPKHSDIQVLWNLEQWTQSKSTFILIIILHRQNPIEFT